MIKGKNKEQAEFNGKTRSLLDLSRIFLRYADWKEWKTLELILYFPQLRNYRSWLRSCYYFLSFDCEKFDSPVFTIITSIKQKRKAVRVF